MIYGVQIDDINTLTEWGLILLQDVSIGAAQVKTNYISVPEADGALDLTAALTGIPVYENREISFTLFAGRGPGGKGGPANEWDFERIKAALSAYCSGQIRRLILPDDPNHCFIGRMQVGDKGGYNSGRVQVTMQADPWRYKNEVTEHILSVPGTYVLGNEGKRAIPTLEATAAAAITFNGETYELTAGENRIDEIIFTAGRNTVTLEGSGEITISYQEAHL